MTDYLATGGGDLACAWAGWVLGWGLKGMLFSVSLLGLTTVARAWPAEARRDLLACGAAVLLAMPMAGALPGLGISIEFRSPSLLESALQAPPMPAPRPPRDGIRAPVEPNLGPGGTRARQAGKHGEKRWLLEETPGAPAASSNLFEGGWRRAFWEWLWVAALLVWAAGVLAVGFRWAVSGWALRRILRRTRPVGDGAAMRLAEEISRELGLRRPPELMIGERVDSPLICSVLRPLVILPCHYKRWSRSRTRMVLRHELQHVASRDLLWQSLSLAACALHWFNPLAWVAHRRLCIEQERACDRWVVRMGEDPADYAELLLRASLGLREIGGSSALGFLKRFSLRERLFEVLRMRREKPSPSAWPFRPVALAMTLALGLALAAARPQDATASAQLATQSPRRAQPGAGGPSPADPGPTLRGQREPLRATSRVARFARPSFHFPRQPELRGWNRPSQPAGRTASRSVLPLPLPIISEEPLPARPVPSPEADWPTLQSAATMARTQGGRSTGPAGEPEAPAPTDAETPQDQEEPVPEPERRRLRLATIPIPSLGGHSAAASDVSETGIVVGSSMVPSGAVHPFLWTAETGTIDLGVPEGWLSAWAERVNERGDVLVRGFRRFASGGQEGSLFLWSPQEGYAPVGALPGCERIGAAELNAVGQVAGLCDLGFGKRSFFWSRDSGVVDLGALGLGGAFTTDTVLAGLNRHGVIAGTSAAKAFVWTLAEGLRPLETEGLEVEMGEPALASQSLSINSAGQVAGSVLSESGSWPVLWDADGRPALIGPVHHPADPRLTRVLAEALAVNETGEVLGRSRAVKAEEDGRRRLLASVFLWNPEDGLRELSDLRHGASGFGAAGRQFNERRQFVGWVEEDGRQQQALLWSPEAGPLIADVWEGDERSAAIAVNGSGQAVGWGSGFDLQENRRTTPMQALLWEVVEEQPPSEGGDRQ